MTSKTTYYRPKHATDRKWHDWRRLDLDHERVTTFCGLDYQIDDCDTEANPPESDICRRCEPERKP